MKYKRAFTFFQSSSAIAFAALAINDASFAQSTDTNAAIAFEEIVVTARRRDESLQDVPIAITVFTEESIQKRGIEGLDDFAKLAPNVTFTNALNLGTNYLTIRGQTQSQYAPPPAAIVVDGVLTISPLQFNVDEFDLQQIEVLKGPQGAIYGRNAIAGVINLTSRKPDDEFKGRVLVGYGRGEEYKAKASISGPLIADKLFASVGASYSDRRGQIYNIGADNYVDHFEDFTGRTRIIAKPSEALEIDIKYTYSDTKGTDPAYITSSTGDSTQVDDPINVDHVGSNPRTLHDLSGKIDWDTEAGTLTAILAYVNIEEGLSADFDFSPADLFRAEQIRKHDGFSQELRFTSNQDSALRWLVGGYHVKNSGVLGTDLYIEPFLFGITPTPVGTTFLFQSTVDENNYENYAGFGQLEYDITDKLELAVALRYDEDSNNQNGTLNAKFTKWQPKATLTYKSDAGFTVYSSVGQGFRAGDFNSSTATFGESIIEAETATTYEIGFKGQLLENRILTSAAVFYTDLKNGQFKLFDAGSAGNVGINIDKTEIKGFEIETAFLITQELKLNAGFGYTDAKIKNFVPPSGYAGSAADYIGNTPPLVPDYSLSIGLSYERPITDNLAIFLTSDYSRIDSWYWDPENDYIREPVNYLDIRVGLQNIEATWSVTAWVKNALNDRTTPDYQSITTTGHPLGIDAYYPAIGATYGIQATFNF
ncbi:TonB-dependent receptor [Kordiimonas pumila]|uniref:TonB-dependent receptor n=1 Tax=Kordiimonas pumila TaxID=2161677 RepID=A0ABV7D6T0_9PROT|nr:TonB-dependent receptor [Kordiimonas pumila]